MSDKQKPTKKLPDITCGKPKPRFVPVCTSGHTHGSHCDHDHKPLIPLAPAAPTPPEPHVHTESCDHSHDKPLIPLDIATPTLHEHTPHCDHSHDKPLPVDTARRDTHFHGPDCNHQPQHVLPSTWQQDIAPVSQNLHYHGSTPCTHVHPPAGIVHETHLPKGKSNAGLWLAGITAAVGASAYLINEYGKPPKVNSKDWKERIEPPAQTPERSV